MNGSMSTNKGSHWFTLKKALIAGTIAVVCLFLWGVYSNQSGTVADVTVATAPVTRGDLIVDVLEASSIDAAESQIIRSKVEGKATLIFIIPEGSTITHEDVENKKVLVQMDSADLRDRRTQQTITVQSGRAALTEASESFLIQVKTNESALKAGELKVKFGLMDLEKYLGQNLATAFLDHPEIAFSELIESASLGGEALQKRREMSNTKLLEEIQETLAKEKLEWTTKLHDRGFVSLNDFKVDQLAVEKSKVALEKADTAINLFKDYEFQKEAEKLRSDYQESVRDLDRIKAKNRSELAKAEAKLASASATYQNQVDQLEKINQQIENCTIIATQPGLVVYAGSDNPMRDRRIEEGAEVFERQEIIKIPNTTSMLAKARIHETVIARIKEGQKAFITAESLPDKTYQGVVKKVGILPDSQDRWRNPDLKVYQTDLSIQGDTSELKPGMTAQARIIISELRGVLQVPVQAVETRGKESYCFLMTPKGPERRQIVTGEYNDKFIEIKEGLKEGDKVALSMSSFDSPMKPGDQHLKDGKAEGNESSPPEEEQKEEGEGRHEREGAPPPGEGSPGMEAAPSREGMPPGGSDQAPSERRRRRGNGQDRQGPPQAESPGEKPPVEPAAPVDQGGKKPVRVGQAGQ